MKLRSTTPASKTSRVKLSLIAISAALIVAVPVQMTRNVSADQYDDQIYALQQEINQFNAQLDILNAQSATLQSTISTLQNQAAVIQAQIDISQAKYDQLVKQIAETEKKINDSQDALGQTIANMYVDDNISPIELLAGSNNLSEYMDKQEYRASVRDELTSTIAQVKKLKAELSQQKIDVEKVLADQKTQKEALVAKQGEQQRILNDTQGQEAAYQNMIGANQSKIAEARAIQAAINSRYTGSGGYLLIDSGSLGDYPWDDSNCPMWGYLSTGGADGNGGDGHGYGCRQCASYVAWRFAKETGIYPSWGNAVNFTANAKSLGYPEGDAQAGSIAVMDAAKAGQGYGHVAWVETDPYVNNRGQTVIQVSQYNYDFGWGFGYYSRMELSVNAFDHYIHIK